MTNRIGRATFLRSLVGGLVAYEIVKAVMWLRDWPHVVDLMTNADHEIYYQAALRIRAGGPVYPPFELAGPFTMNQLPELYPPPTLFGLIVPMSYLPAVLWWLIPLAVIIGVVAHHRPSLLAWAGIVACLLPERTWVSIAAGNPALWACAFLALATIRPAFAPFVLLKPTLAPFALWGIRHREWWIGLAAFALLSLAVLPLWNDYLTVVRNAEGGFLSSVENVPLMLVPVVAWLGRSRNQVEHDTDAVVERGRLEVNADGA